MRAKSIHGKSVADIQSALNHSMDDGYKPTLAIVFISIKQDRNAICNLLDSKNIDVFGATSCGEFIDGYQSEGEIAILLLELSKEHYTILFEAFENNSLEKITSNLAKAASNKFKNPSLIICSTGINKKGELKVCPFIARSEREYENTTPFELDKNKYRAKNDKIKNI